MLGSKLFDIPSYIGLNDEIFLLSRHFFCLFTKLRTKSLKIPWMMGGGQSVPAGLSCPPPPPPPPTPPRFLSSGWLWIKLLLLIALTTINRYVSQNTDTDCWYSKTHFLKFSHFPQGQGRCKISQLVYLIPHPRFWSNG